MSDKLKVKNALRSANGYLSGEICIGLACKIHNYLKKNEK
jgi:hypothetical protein